MKFETRFPEEADLADSIRKELRTQPFRLVGMHVSDAFEALVRSTIDALLLVATGYVWVGLLLPGSLRSIASDTVSQGLGGAAFGLFMTAFVVRGVVRMERDEMTKTYDRQFKVIFDKRKGDLDTVRLIESVLERHGLIRLNLDGLRPHRRPL